MGSYYIYLYVDNEKKNTLTNKIHHSSCKRLIRSLKSKKLYKTVPSKEEKKFSNVDDLVKELVERNLPIDFCSECPSRSILTEDEIISQVKSISTNYYKTGKVPKPYIGREKIKAILLGCDPGNNSDSKRIKEFSYVFGLENKESSYFKITIKPNILALNINLENLYVQNVCRNYFDKETSKQKKSEWKKCAYLWLPNLKNELDKQDPTMNIPIMVTSDIIMEVLINNKPSNIDIYEKIIIFNKESNYLERELIALYRNKDYKLENWPLYKEKVKSIIESKMINTINETLVNDSID